MDMTNQEKHDLINLPHYHDFKSNNKKTEKTTLYVTFCILSYNEVIVVLFLKICLGHYGLVGVNLRDLFVLFEMMILKTHH
jgi:hypothetical protein